jgi:hypothetical protein
MRRLFSFSALVLILLLSSTATLCQQLTVQTESAKRVVLSRTDREALPHVTVTASEHSACPVNFEGVSLKSVLEKVGFPRDRFLCLGVTDENAELFWFHRPI